MKDQEDEKDVGGKGKIEAKVLENGRPTWNLAVTQSHKGEGQSQEKYEPKQIKRKANKRAQVRGPSMKRSHRALKRRSISDLGLSCYGA